MTERRQRIEERRRERLGIDLAPAEEEVTEEPVNRIGPRRPAITVERDGQEQAESNYSNYKQPYDANSDYDSPAIDQVVEELPSINPEFYDDADALSSAVASAIRDYFADEDNATEWSDNYALGRLYAHIQDALNIESDEARQRDAREIIDAVDALIAEMQDGA
jgi:hypothetical protein